MAESATAPLPFAPPLPLPLEVDFEGGRLTNDGSLPWLEEVDCVLGLYAGLATVIPEWRRRRRHDLRTLVAQRVLQVDRQSLQDLSRCRTSWEWVPTAARLARAGKGPAASVSPEGACSEGGAAAQGRPWRSRGREARQGKGSCA
jgi:hypothetical protein